MRGCITPAKLVAIGTVLVGLGGIGWAEANSDGAATSADAIHIQALARAFHVSPQVVEELRTTHATQGWGAVAVHLAQAQPPAQTEPAAVPSHTVQVRALAKAFHVSPQVVEELWAKHAKEGWGAVAFQLAQAPSPAQTDVVIASTER